MAGTIDSLSELGWPEEIFREVKPFRNLMMRYRCAMLEIETKFRVLDSEFSLQHNRNPIETIKTRLKTPDSIIEKMERKGWEMTAESVEANMHDVAGIRIICSFIEDIYMLADKIVGQDDITLLEKKDYIANPKPNGYRSLHLILEIPIFLSNEKKNMRVEVQLRTIAMDFWASLEHKLRYKQDIEDSEMIAEELRKCADTISQVDGRMQEIRQKIG